MTVSPAVEHAWGADDDPVLDVSVRYRGGSAVIEVRGDLDVLTTPDLRALLGAVIAGGHPTVVLDLGQVSLLGAAGVGVIAASTAEARQEGGSLTVRSPSRLARRVLEACAMSHLIRAESLDPPAAPLRPSVPIATLVAMGGANDMIDAALSAFTALTQEAMAGADGVSVTLARSGLMTTVGASNETIAQMDRDQYATGEGPSLAAAASGQRFHIRSIGTEQRWPNFVRRAKEDGIASILSTPLLVGGRAVGALNIYSNTDGAFAEADEDTALVYAGHASALLAETTVTLSDAAFAERLRGALDAREVIAFAQGALMARRGVTAEDAYATLRHAARRAETTVKEQAVEVLGPPTHPSSTGRAPA